MGVNAYIGGSLALRDDALMDSIIEMDTKSVLWIVNKKYKTTIINKGCIKEPMSVEKMVQALEDALNKKGINVKGVM